jgi:NAD(P)-dependent dehydrogenase (short-subunit alcohol dehydrogenase family)
MTDLRRHLPLILNCLRAHVAQTEHQSLHDAVTTCRAELVAALPASYIVAAGSLVDARRNSTPPANLVILDGTVPPGDVPAGALAARQALLVALAGDIWDSDDLAQALTAIAAIKAVRPPQNIPSGEGKRLPKAMLPLGVVCVRQLAMPGVADVVARGLALADMLAGYPMSQRPDILTVLGDGLDYRHPTLVGGTMMAETIGFARMPDLAQPHVCYACKTRFVRRHLAFDALCMACGDVQLRKRQARVDLAGRVALVTGGRSGIGHATALRLLRAGARVIVTTRFPHAAARCFTALPDCAAWHERLHIYGLDLRHLPTLERFIQHILATYQHLDILINNAAQTVRRPLSAYAELLPGERAPLAALPPQAQPWLAEAHAHDFTLSSDVPERGSLAREVPARVPSLLAAVAPAAPDIPETAHSWTLRITDGFDVSEVLETQIVNVTAPFLLINQLAPMLARSPHPLRFIINVAAAEGQFAAYKSGRHPHTNMAKAALNMLTRTVAPDLARQGICLCSVDPGWVSSQLPDDAARDAQLPLDRDDAAARVCDPIFTGIATGSAPSGVLLKDYQTVAW